MLKDIFCMLDEDNDKKTQNKGIGDGKDHSRYIPLSTTCRTSV